MRTRTLADKSDPVGPIEARYRGAGIRELNYIGMARLAAPGVVFALAGCVTVENSLSQNDIANVKLTGRDRQLSPRRLVLRRKISSRQALKRRNPARMIRRQIVWSVAALTIFLVSRMPSLPG